MQEKSPEFWASVGMAIGAGVWKLLSVIFSRHFSEAASIRRELRKRADDLEKKISEVYREVDSWREKYFEQLSANNELKSECRALRFEIEKLKAASNKNDLANK